MGDTNNSCSTEAEDRDLNTAPAAVDSGPVHSTSRIFSDRSRWWLRVFTVAGILFGGSIFTHRYWVQSRNAAFLTRCKEAQKSGDWAVLRETSEQWCDWDATSVDAMLYAADASTHLDDFESAVIFLSKIPDSDPRVLPSLVVLSNMQFGPIGRPLDGVRTCERILRIDKRATAAHHQLIEFYAITLQKRKLEQQIRFAIECQREPPRAYVYLFLMDTMRIAGASESNSRWLEQNPGSELFEVARVLHLPEPENGVSAPNGDDKYSLADQLLKSYPDNLELLAYKVDVNQRSGSVSGVMQFLSSLPLEADEDNRFWRAKGWLHLTRNELTSSNEALNEAIRLFPMDWYARNLLADLLRKQGQLAEAEKLHDLVQSARQLRLKINAIAIDQEIPHDILSELAGLAAQCNDQQVAEALHQRLEMRNPSGPFRNRPR